MKKIFITLLILFVYSNINAQTGIATKYANSTVTVNGSLQAKYREVNTNTTINEDDYYITYVGTEEAEFILPSIKTGELSFTGRIYRIKNLSKKKLTLIASDGNQIRVNSTPIDEFEIQEGGYIEAVNNSNTNGGTWDVSFVGHPNTQQNLDFYSVILKVPPHNTSDWVNNNNPDYDTEGTNTGTWKIISKQSIDPMPKYAPLMKLVYEFQGEPFDINKLTIMLTTGINTTAIEVYTASVIDVNNINGKTRLTISIARNDFIQLLESRWTDELKIYTLFINNKEN